MIVKKLQLVNFQVIEKFEGDFEGNVYFITGDNELGKSTLLKAIGALLTGERDAVLRKGQEKGFAKMVVGDDGEEYEVELRFTKANPRGTLSIKQKTTGMKSDNLTMIQRIFGYQDFDAVEFIAWSNSAEGRRKQIQVVRSLLPETSQIRIGAIDSEVFTLKEKRKDVNSSVKAMTAICANAEKSLTPSEIHSYTKAIDITDLMREQQQNAQLIEKAKTYRSALQTRTEQLAAIPSRIEEAKEILRTNLLAIDKSLESAKKEHERLINEANQMLKNATEHHAESVKEEKEHCAGSIHTIEEERKDFEYRKGNAQTWLNKYEENNPEKLDVAEQLKKAEEHNKKVALVSDYLTKKKALETEEKRASDFDTQIDTLGKERETLITNSKLPIAGLSFSEDGLELNGIPFVSGKVSDSQIMEIAAKLIITSNPTVKVFRIARGESLGAKRLQSIIEIAKNNGFQGFIEEVKRGQDNLIVEEYTED